MSYHLFLDDERMPSHVNWVKLPEANWIIVRSLEEFKAKVIELGVPEFVAFDHDLCFGHYNYCQTSQDALDLSKKGPTGYDCAVWLIEHCKLNKSEPPMWSCHTRNEMGKYNIDRALHKAHMDHVYED